MDAPIRTVSVTETTHVRHVARPWGGTRENGPHLHDLRAFVAACDGLADDTLVRIEPGQLDEGGRRNVTLTATIRTTLPTPAPDSPGGQ